MTETLRQRQEHLLASAPSGNHPVWGLPPSGVSPRHQHLLERELIARNDNGAATRKRDLTAVSGGIADQGGISWKNPKIDSKQAMRSEKKREQEKQRRSDLNEKFAALIHVVKRIETEDDEVERKRAQAEEAIRKRRAEQEAKEEDEETKIEKIKAGKEDRNEENVQSDNGSIEGSNAVAETSRKKQEAEIESTSVSAIAELISAERRSFKRRFPCFISPSNRSDLIARAVSHLMKYSKIRNRLNEDLDVIGKKLEEVTRRNEESEQKLNQMEGVGMMAATSTNPMITTTGDSKGEGATGGELYGTDTTKPPPPTAATKSELQQQQEQQQQQQLQVRNCFLCLESQHKLIN